MSEPQASLYTPGFASDWDRVQLYSLAQWINGMTFRSINFSSSGRPVIKIAEIKNGTTSQTQFTDSSYDEKYLVRPGDMLFSWSGQPETSIDVFWWDGPEGWLNQHVFKVLPNTDLVDRDFFYQLLKYLKPLFIRIARNKQTTGLGHVTKGDLEKMEVALPPPDEQRRIAGMLAPLDAKIASNRRACALLEAETQAVFESLFDVSQKDAGVAISELVSINPRRPLQKGTTSTYIAMADLPTDSALIASWGRKTFSSGQRFVNDDVLMARITPCLENGKTAVVDMLEDGETGFGSTEFIVLCAKHPLTMPWVYCLARSSEVREFAIRNMVGTSGRQRFPAPAFDTYFMAEPDDFEVSKFNDLAVPSFRRMSRLRDESLRLGDLRDVLLPELFAGRPFGLTRTTAVGVSS